MDARPQNLSLGRRLLFGAVVAFLVLVVIEGMLQLFYYLSAGEFLAQRTVPPIYQSDDIRCYRIRSNLAYRHRTNEFDFMVYTNDAGLRSDESRKPLVVDKPPGTYRILLLGPSFAFGWGSDYKDIYATRIERGLRDDGLNVELVNLGTPGQGPGPQLCWLQEMGERLKPDLVLQTVYGQATGLPTGCNEEHCPVVSDHKLYRTQPTLKRKAIYELKNLAIVFYSWYALQRLRTFSADQETGVGKELQEEKVPFDADPKETAQDYEAYARFVHSVVGDSTQIVFLYIPFSFVVHVEDTPRWTHLLNPVPLLRREAASRAFDELRRDGLVVIDTTPTLLEGAQSQRMYYWLDIHLTPAGNEAVARASLPVLEPIVARAVAEASAGRD